MHYLFGIAFFCWATILFCILFFPITVPIVLVFPCLMWGRTARTLTAPIPWSVGFPSLFIAAMFAWGTAFGQTTTGPWRGYQWPAAVALGIFVGACVVAWHEWRRSNRDQRVAALLTVQLWFGAVGTFVVASGVSAGSGLGAL